MIKKTKSVKKTSKVIVGKTNEIITKKSDAKKAASKSKK